MKYLVITVSVFVLILVSAWGMGKWADTQSIADCSELQKQAAEGHPRFFISHDQFLECQSVHMVVNAPIL